MPLPQFLQTLSGHPLRWLIGTGKLIATYHVFTAYGYSLNLTRGPSMLPTLDIYGDVVLISKRHRYGRDVKVGDLVVYRIPIAPNAEGIKRVIGLPGDYVLVDSPDSLSGTMTQVPEGHCWLVGDNLTASRDSRYFGPVPLGLVRGKVLSRIMPLADRKWIENPLQRPPVS